jgi:large subunit ribosomal protein L13
MGTFFPDQKEIEREWFLVDAAGKVLGRLASQIAAILQGKHKPVYTPFLDTGDFVVVVNAGKVRLTGKKMKQKFYHRYSGYPGGMKSTRYDKLLKKHPERAISLAVKRMLPKNRLGRRMFRKLKVYAGPTHPHEAQCPSPLDL